MFTTLFARLRALAASRRIAGEIDEELHDHLERDVAARVARGLTPAEAHRQALIDLGGLTQTRESLHDVRRGPFVALAQVLSPRQLRRQPQFVASCVLTLMLAVAAATTMGAVIKPALLDPLPYRADAELVMINSTGPAGGAGPVNVHTLMDLRAGTPPLSAIAAARGSAAALALADGVYPIAAYNVEPHYFATLGVTPAIGRVWQDNETRVVVLTWRFWQQTLDADPAAIGRSLTIDGVDRAVIGVMPRDFVAPWNPGADVLLPIDFGPLVADPYRARRMLSVVARLAPGSSLENVSAYLSLFSARMAREHPNVPGGQTLAASSLRERMIGSSRPVMLGMAAATALLLLIVAANVAGLAAVRAFALRRQTAVKIALGASRGRIAAERIGESVIVALAGSAAGVGLSALLIAIVRTYQAQFLGALAAIGLSPSLGIAGFAVGVIVGTSAGALPYLTLRRGGEDPLRAARGSAGDRASARLRMGLVVVQTGLALALVIGAGLLARTLNHLAATPIGFDPARLTSFFVNLPGPRYAKQPSQIQFEHDLLARLEHIPGIEAVTASIGIPISGGMGAGLYIEGGTERGTPIHYMSVAPNFREVLGLQMLAGRPVDPTDLIGSPRTLVINETMARRFWPQGNALGARIFVGVAPSENWMTVVGIVADARQHGPGFDVMPTAFGSTRQYSWPRRHFVFRTAEGRAVAAADLRGALRQVDPTLAITGLTTMDGLLTEQQATRQFVLFVLGSFALVAALLAALGLYSVLALTSSLRRREFAIRVALGSTSERVKWMVVRQALVLGTTGVALGVGVAWATTRTLQGLLSGVDPNDPLTMASASAAVLFVALLAAWFPARRAGKVNGAEVLAEE